MKMSKTKLKSIIKEELLNVLAESEETREQGTQRIHQEKLAEIEEYLNGLPDGGEEYRQWNEMDEEIEDYINEKGYDTNDPFIAKYDELSKKIMPIQKEVAKITKKHQKRMSTELPKGEKSYVQMQYDRDGVGVQTYDRYLEKYEEGIVKEGEYNAGERSERDLMIANIYEMIDDIYGTKSLARRYKFSEMSDEEIHALHKEWEAEYSDWHNEERVQDDLEDLYIQSEKELNSLMDLDKAEKEAEAQRQLMMTPEEGEEFPKQAGMGKKITTRNTRNRMQEMIHKEMSYVLVEMFGDSMSLQKGDEYYHQRFPDLMNYGVIVQGEDERTVLLQAMGAGFEPKVKSKQKFRMPKDLFLRTFIEKSNEIDFDTGKRINVINLGNRGEEKNGY